MKNVCKKCGEETKADEKFCGNCGTKLSENQETNSMKEIIVSTGDIKKDYYVIKPIHLYHHSLNNKERFDEKNISVEML